MLILASSRLTQSCQFCDWTLNIICQTLCFEYHFYSMHARHMSRETSFAIRVLFSMIETIFFNNNDDDSSSLSKSKSSWYCSKFKFSFSFLFWDTKNDFFITISWLLLNLSMRSFLLSRQQFVVFNNNNKRRRLLKNRCEKNSKLVVKVSFAWFRIEFLNFFSLVNKTFKRYNDEKHNCFNRREIFFAHRV